MSTLKLARPLANRPDAGKVAASHAYRRQVRMYRHDIRLSGAFQTLTQSGWFVCNGKVFSAYDAALEDYANPA